MKGTVKKIIGCVIALLIAAGSIPVSLLYFTTPIVAEGQLVKLTPISDTFVYSEAKNKNRSRLDEKNDIVGNYWNTYLKFDLSGLGSVTKSDISRAKLRLAVLSSGTGRDGEDTSFNVSFLDNDNWNENMSWAMKPRGEEQYLCTAAASGPNTILDIEITEFIKKAVGFNDKVITIKLSPGLSSNAPVTIASVNSDDPILRPCLKVALDGSEDSDLSVLSKSHLIADAYVSASEPDTSGEELLMRNNGYLAVDNGSAAYLKFSLEPRNILGAVKHAVLKLRPAVKSANTKIDVYCLKNNDWNTSGITYSNRPQGDVQLLKSYSGIDIGGELEVDVTDIIYDLIRNGEYLVSFIVDGTDTNAASTDTAAFYSSMSTEGEPKLEITVTDDSEETALAEAKANLLGENSSADNITTDLPSEYTAENGLRVSIKWTSDSSPTLFGGFLGFKSSAVSQYGRINRPAYLENPESVRVKAELSIGGHTDKKFLTLTIVPEDGIPTRLDILKKALSPGFGG